MDFLLLIDIILWIARYGVLWFCFWVMKAVPIFLSY